MSLAHPPNDEDTIAALGTPPGVGAIAIVRVSGPEAREIANRVFRGARALVRAEPQTVQRGYALGDSGARLDEVLATVFVAPKSYTGEDLVEISCHGGPLPAALVLEAVLKAGARPAGPGEFTKRAFLSGRLDLSQAEAVAEIVGARSRAGLKAALSQLDGALSTRVRRLREELVGLLAEIEARLDFSEDIEEPVQAEEIGRAISSAEAQLDELLEGASLGRLVREGARVVIAGRPNVGKSSLLNALVGRDRAIVTPVPGTTRDTIEEWVELEGVLLTLADTAGLRAPGDAVEAAGVRRTRQLIHESQLVLAVVEMPSAPSADEMGLITELASESPVIPVLNKIDLGGDAGKWTEAINRASERGRTALHDGRPAQGKEPGRTSAADPGPGARPERWPSPVLPCAFVSARTGHGVPELRGRIVEALCGSKGSLEAYQDEILLTNVRHVDALRRARQALERARDGLEGGLAEELLAFEVGQALHAMGEVSGESVTEEVLETIFSRFCIGK